MSWEVLHVQLSWEVAAAGAAVATSAAASAACIHHVVLRGRFAPL